MLMLLFSSIIIYSMSMSPATIPNKKARGIVDRVAGQMLMPVITSRCRNMSMSRRVRRLSYKTTHPHDTTSNAQHGIAK